MYNFKMLESAASVNASLDSIETLQRQLGLHIINFDPYKSHRRDSRQKHVHYEVV